MALPLPVDPKDLSECAESGYDVAKTTPENNKRLKQQQLNQSKQEETV